MIAGTIYLISLLFFGGASEYFLIDKLEKGVKKYVVDKERKKEITADLKAAKKYIKAFNKERKSQLKSFQDMNTDRNSSKEEFIVFFDELMNQRIALQEKVLGDRIMIAEKIKQEEWKLIIENSKESVEKAKEKQQKKVDKGKYAKPFEKTIATIEENVIDNERKDKIQNALNKFIHSQTEAINKLRKMNAEDSNILNNKDALKVQLTQLAKELNNLRRIGFNDLIDFHMSAKEFTTQAEWDKIMKAFNKELSITAH